MNQNSLVQWQTFLVTIVVVGVVTALAIDRIISAEAIMGILGAAVPTGTLFPHSHSTPEPGVVVPDSSVLPVGTVVQNVTPTS